MIVAVACVPQAPLLLPGLTGRPIPEVEKLREAAATAVASVLEHDLDDLLILAATPATGTFPPRAALPTTRLAPHPPSTPVHDGTGTSVLPVSLAVGRSFLPDGSVPVRLQGIAADAPPAGCRELGLALGARPGRSGLVVAADGSARRGEKAPGHLDPRAAGFDAGIGTALGGADTARLAALDPALCHDLLVAGRAAWQVMAAACEDARWLAHTLYEDAPFGVAYWVTTWIRQR